MFGELLMVLACLVSLVVDIAIHKIAPKGEAVSIRKYVLCVFLLCVFPAPMWVLGLSYAVNDGLTLSLVPSAVTSIVILVNTVVIGFVVASRYVYQYESRW